MNATSRNVSRIRGLRPATIPAIFALLATTACLGPILIIPGGAIRGEAVTIRGTAWPEHLLPESSGTIQLETRPEAPYSVNLTARRIGDHLYIDPAPDRGWYAHIQADDRVRVRLPGSALVHPARVVEETDPAVVSQFTSDRIVLRVVPRTPVSPSMAPGSPTADPQTP